MDCSTMSGEEVVISGIAGKFPNSENISIFQKNLLNKEDLLSIKNPKWKTGDLEFPEKSGLIPGVDNFDAQSFGIYKKFAQHMDPAQRLLLQCSYESITDAGINPRTLRGKKIAVFTGGSSGETEQILDYNPNEATALMGSGKSMFANRISFFLDLHGPSTNVNSANISSATALEKAFNAIKNGEVEGAIVGGENVTLYPHFSFQLSKLGLLSPDGLTKSFDESANGYARSEAVVVFFLQKARFAKRIYAEIKNVHTWCGPSYDRLSVLYPTSNFQNELMQLTLKECSLSGKDISFVEADGLGIKEADIEEISAIDNAFNDGRTTPLLVGSVKSNVGSCHGANTLVSIVKVITMMESGFIPPNLHYKHPSNEMSAIHEGRIQVVTELSPWNGEYAAINTTSISGGVATVILKCFKKKEENRFQYNDKLPRLIMVSGVTEDSVNTILDYMDSKPVNVELSQMIDEIFEVENKSHLYRGYTLLPPSGVKTSEHREIQFSLDSKREIWYIFSGMGSQWIGMGSALMKLPIFVESVRKCDAVLKPHGINIFNILTTVDQKIFDNIIHSFVGIITIQIGLVDLLNYLGIKPDFMIGHSVGELGCAYADGCLTAEQAVLNAMFRGFASVETKLPKGLMAAVGLGYEDIKQLCPSDIDVACHNSIDSSTISGPQDSMRSFISILQAKGIFAKEVQTSNIAFHSRYISPAGPKLLEYLRKIVPNSIVRSSKWLSTSVPKNEWSFTKARLSSAEYYTNNLLCPVLFEEVTKMVPNDAITIEIAPCGLLQAILKRSLPETVINLSLTKRGHKNNIEVIMETCGKLYIKNCDRPHISKLYSKISYPVSPGTPSISSLIKWDHSEIWSRNVKQLYHLVHETREKIYNIDLSHENWKYLKDNKIRNENIIPCSLYFKLVLSSIHDVDESKKTITFENVVIHSKQCINEQKILQITVMVQAGSGNFEVSTNGNLLCSGVLKNIDSFEQEKIVIPNLIGKSNVLHGSDVYNELTLSGYQYSKSFKTVCKFNRKELFGYIAYQEDWHIFLEGMLQMYMLASNIRTTQVPSKIQKLNVDLQSYENRSKCLSAIPVIFSPQYNTVRSFGMELYNIQTTSIKEDFNGMTVNIEEIKFTFNFDEALILPEEFCKMVLQLLIENNVNGSIVQFVEENVNTSNKSQKPWKAIFKKSLGSQFNFEIVSALLFQSCKCKDIALQVFFDAKTLIKINLLDAIEEGGFVLAILETQDLNLKKIENLGLRIILSKRLLENQVAILFRKKRFNVNTCIVEIVDTNFVLTEEVREKINSLKFERIIISTRLADSYSKCEIFNILSSEQIKNKVRYFEILNNEAPPLSLEESFYKNQLELDLKYNILTTDRKWGFRSYVPIATKRHRVSNSVLVQSRAGDLDSFNWVEQSCKNNEDNKLIKVEYSTINTNDVLLASGDENLTTNKTYCESKKIKNNIKLFGLEYAGTDSNGDRIIGLSGSGTLCSFTSVDSELMWKVPNTWTLEEAATVPLAYASAYMALYLKGQIEKKSSVFIYDGCCAIGQAAIALALNEEAQVFSTYRTAVEKKRLLLQYPSLNENQLFHLDNSFDDKFLSLNKGVRVDLVVYNSNDLNGFESCLKCAKDVQGSFIIVGKLEESFKKSVGMYVFLEHFGMHSIIPQNLINADLSMKRQLSSMMKNGLRSGVVKPIFSNLYSRDEVKEAFINASRNLCYGKIVIKIQPVDSNIRPLVIPSFSCLKNRMYLLLIDNWDNLFGIKLIDFLIEHGAKNITVASTIRNTPKAIYYYHLKIWEESEVKIIFRENLDLSDYSNFEVLLNEPLNPIDVIFDIQRMTSSQTSLRLKHSITKNLFENSKKICQDLRKFIIFTSLNKTDNDFNVYLFKENNLMTFSEGRSNGSLQAQLILWDPIEELVQSTFSNVKKSNLFTIPQCMQELDILMVSPVSNVAVSYKSNMINDKSTTFVKEKSEKELFEDYIFNKE